MNDYKLPKVIATSFQKFFKLEKLKKMALDKPMTKKP